MWLKFTLMGTQLLWFVPQQTYETYPWQANVLPSIGLWHMPGVHHVTALPTALNWGKPDATHTAVFPAVKSIW